MEQTVSKGTEEEDSKSQSHWIPIECNPEYMYNVGIKENSAFFCDVYGFEEQLLDMVPRPVLAVIFLFPVSSPGEKLQDGVLCDKADDSLFFMKQYIDNACATVAILHALCNNVHRLNINENTAILHFVESVKGKSYEETGLLFTKNAELANCHEHYAMEGQTTASSNNDQKTDLHFICFVCNNCKLYELDGRYDLPIYHGETSDATLLQDSAKVASERMRTLPNDLRYAMMALVGAPAD